MPLALAFFFWAMALITVALFIARVWWLPELASAHGGAIDDQLVLTLVLAGIVFFLAQAALGYFIWRFRARGSERASYWHENPKMEVTWTVATAILFIGLGIQGNRVWAKYILTQAPPDAVTVEVTGQQFAWNMRYAGADGKFGRTDPKLINDANANFLGLDEADPAAHDDVLTQNLMAIPVNRPIGVILRAKDVTHSFYVPQLRVKQDAVPGMGIRVTFTATKTGEFEIACAELCGMQHYKMRGRLLVMSDADYEKWLKDRAAAQ
ncbi:MAG: cytochrome c oxidase subunit II [Bryobacteraceae bacterium]|nr:cytochrome c oxidase subunit II [Bryobacteraceae bacterium]